MNLIVLALQFPHDFLGFLCIIMHQLVSDLELLGQIFVLNFDVFDDVDDLPQFEVQLLVFLVPDFHLFRVPLAVCFIIIEPNELLLSVLVQSLLQVLQIYFFPLLGPHFQRLFPQNHFFEGIQSFLQFTYYQLFVFFLLVAHLGVLLLLLE